MSEPRTKAGRAYLYEQRNPSTASMTDEEAITAIESEASGLTVERLTDALPGFLNFRSFIVPRPVGDPAWRTLAEDLAARLAQQDSTGE